MGDIFILLLIILGIGAAVVLYQHVYLIRFVLGVIVIIIGIVFIFTLVGGAAGAAFVKAGISMISDK